VPSLISLLTSSGTPSSVARAIATCRKSLFGFIDDEAALATLAERLEGTPAAAPLLARLLEGSPFLTRLMRRWPDWLAASLDGDPAARMSDLLGRMAAISGEAGSIEDAMAPMRRLRNEVALHIALADCAGLWPVERVTEALTAFADAATAAALEVSLARLAEAGRLVFAQDAPFAPASGLTILAMGKHGAGELNYSSDIDLIVLFEPRKVPVRDGLEPLDLAVQVTKDIVRLLHEPTGDGFVFRVDLRLRPDPASTPIAMPVGGALAYYESVGQNWERAAMIKARPIAGDLALGAGFLKELQPFIWRKYFDYAAIADIHAMKRQIYAHKGHEAIAIEGHDIKLGRGGIREIEFFVQTQQLVFGGRRPHLRGARTLDMLPFLEQDGWIGRRAVEDLANAYRFLRMVEHRLQMVDDEQTQRLPREPQALDAFARFAGFTPSGFRKALVGHLRRVETHYAKLFEHAPELTSSIGNLVFTGTADDPDTLSTLRRLGFTRPELVAETIRGWHFGRRAAVTTPRAREVLTELVPSLLEAFGRSSDPDGGLIALDNAFARMPAVVELFSILKSNQPLRVLIAEVFGSAPRLADIVANRPHVLDALVDPAFLNPVTDSAAIKKRIRASVAGAGDTEDFLDRLRYVARAENFVVGAQILSAVFPASEAGAAYAAVAEAIVTVALERVEADFAARHGRVEGGRVAVFALGKLGSRELTATSDLDLVVIRDHAPEAGPSDGEKPLYPADWFARLTQRLISALTVPTRAGALYEIDMRLRPHGNKGPLAASLASFEDYYTGSAELWEVMALTRARAVCGDAGLLAEAEAAIARIVTAPRDGKALGKAAREMRDLVSEEKPADGLLDMKLAPGGLFDLEFIAQVLSLRSQGALVRPGETTGALLALAAGQGALPRATADSLVDAWRLQTGMIQILRLCLDGPADARTLPLALKRRLADAAAVPDFRVLERTLADCRVKVIAAFKQIVG